MHSAVSTFAVRSGHSGGKHRALPTPKVSSASGWRRRKAHGQAQVGQIRAPAALVPPSARRSEIVGGSMLAARLVMPGNGPQNACPIMWPGKPTAVSPRKYSDVIAQITRVLANSSIELAAIRTQGAK